MTTANELLNVWRERGVHVRRDGDELVVRGDVTTAEIAAARALKPALLDLLTPPTGQLVRAVAEAGAIPIPTGNALIAAWRGAVLELGEIAGHPALLFKPGQRLSPGRAGYMTFTQRAAVPDLASAVTALREYVAGLPFPPADVIPAIANSPTLEGGKPAIRCADCSEPCGTAARCSPCAAARVRGESRP